LATFNTILSYSPIIDKDLSGRWKLRGNRQAPSVDESLIRGVPARPIRFTWDASGLLVVAATLVSTDSSFLDVPKAVLLFLEGREFPAMDPRRSRVGMLRIRHGRAWGFANYISTQKPQKNDVMELAFDLSAASCRLSIRGKSESPKQV
jgi:hypothetical protein